MATKIDIDRLVLDKSFHGRTRLNQDAIQRYQEMYRNKHQRPLLVRRDTMQIIDGVHRYHAAKNEGLTQVLVEFTDVPDMRLRAEAYLQNSRHGVPYSSDERDETIWQLYRTDGWTQEAIARTLGLDQGHISRIVTLCDTHKGYDPQAAATSKEVQPVIIRRLLGGDTQQTVADDYKVSRPRIASIWADWKGKAAELYQSGKMKAEVAAEMGLSTAEVDGLLLAQVEGNYEPVNFKPVYSSWWPAWGIDSRYGQKHPGNIPAGLVQNILYFYTRPGDHILDPFAGGGVVMDVCIDMVGRTCEAFDLTPKRADVLGHDILTGLPPCKNVPDFIFLDPPYGLIAEDKYGDNPNDLSHVRPEDFIRVWAQILNGWQSGTLAFLMAGLRRDGNYYDLPMLAGQSLEAADWKIIERAVNAIGCTASDSGMWEQKEHDERLLLHRHVDIWIARK